MTFDESGRLWVFGQDSTGSFADVFSDTVFAGRRELPCAFSGVQSPRIRGDWLVMLCKSARRESGVELQLYRISRSTR